MTKKIIRRKINSALENLDSLDPVLQRVFAARNIVCLDDLNREINHLLPFNNLLDIEKAANRLAEAIEQQQHVIIVGDFDADGATSTALAISALQAFGLQQVTFLVPNRFTYGYGLTPGIVEVAAQKNPDIIITVDNGIASHEGVAHANSLGITVIITDHHLPSAQLPEAYAIVNPNRQGDPFASKCLAGVGVIFYLMLALRSELNKRDWFNRQNIACPNMANLLDLVALGTVADMVSLDKNNRILVYQGLKRMRAGNLRPGIQALLQVAGREYHNMSATECGFILGPRLNAAGRLDDMSLGIACLLEQDLSRANELAKRLEQLNRERRALETQMQKEALDIVDQLHWQQKLPAGLCLYDENWHQGVVGLVASRVKDKINRPVIAFAKVDDETLKGSARSIKGLHIRDALDNIATENPEILSKFGGHTMAAGLSIQKKHFEKFQQLFHQEACRQLREEDLQGIIETDGMLQQQEFNLMLAEKIQQAGPWGQAFAEPLFDGEFLLCDQRLVGQKHLKLYLRIPNSDVYLDAIAFNIDPAIWPNRRCEMAQLVYRLDINEYNGRKKLQLVIEDIQAKILENTL